MARAPTLPCMKVATYTRLSKYQADTTSPARQNDACTNQALSLYTDAEIVPYSDIDRSGYDADVERPGFNEMLANIGDYEALVVYRIDRLTRQGARHLLSIVEDHLAPNDVRLVSVQEPIDTEGQYGELFLVMLSTFAKMEAQRIGERARDTQEWLRENGYWSVGSPPWGFGLREHNGHKKLVVEEDHSDLVERVLAGELLTDLTTDTPLTLTGFRNWLTNPALAGLQTYEGEIMYGEDGEPVTVGEGMIDASTHFRLVELLSGDGISRVRKYLLTGILKCAECGYGMSGRHRKRKSNSYFCQGQYNGTDCPGNSASMSGVEEAVLSWVKGELPAILELGQQAQDQPQEDTSEKLGHLANLSNQLATLLDQLTIEQGLDYDHPQVSTLLARLQRINEEKRSLQEMQRQGTKDDSLLTIDPSRFDDLPDDEKRAILFRVTEMLGPIMVKKAEAPSAGRFDPDRVLLPETSA